MARYTENLIPVMSSDTQTFNDGVYRITVSGFNSNNYPYLATQENTGLWMANGATGWWAITFPMKVSIGKVEILGRSNYIHSSFKIQYQDDLGNWKDIYTGTQKNEYTLQTFELSEHNILSQSWRVNILANHTGSWSGLTTVKMFATLPLSKTLILHDGEYKKWNEGVAEIPAVYSNNLIPTMTSNTSPSGIASASGIHNTDFDAWKAFDKFNASGSGGGWAVANGTHWLAYEFTTNKIIQKYTISARTQLESPKNWTFEGWNGTQWIILDSRVNETSWTDNVLKSFTFKNSNPYTKYRLNISSNNGGAYIVIAELGMMELISDTIPKAQSSWQTISSTLPTVNQFIEKGMDSLTPLLDRKVMQLEPQVMDSKIGILSNESTAKVFSKKLDLNKYIDVRKIEVK